MNRLPRSYGRQEKLEESPIPEPVFLAAKLNPLHFGNCVAGSSQGKWGGEIYVHINVCVFIFKKQDSAV